MNILSVVISDLGKPEFDSSIGTEVSEHDAIVWVVLCGTI